MYVLPESLREQLREYIGTLVQEDTLAAALKSARYLIAVGDQVTYTLLKQGITPDLCIVDYHTRRGSLSQEAAHALQRLSAVRYPVKNPKETITDELWNHIKTLTQQLDSGPYCIEVEGEEDLASLAAIYLAPTDATIIYGLPNKGIVVVPATTTHKKTVKNVLDQM